MWTILVHTYLQVFGIGENRVRLKKEGKKFLNCFFVVFMGQKDELNFWKLSRGQLKGRKKLKMKNNKSKVEKCHEDKEIVLKND